ncbi:site-specific integrase [Listeria monocytogenes]|nr:site-specific integrase [Listeria monocytogenes]EAW7187115.1 site-specific integrase [Listeria monocytogenes]EHL5789019.1 site-specific integrase [Listeria monocytogenes]EIA8551426.1 site-specific integrase [Listeria monocytogenes]EIM0150369.1 site-specific integrase [Listeria monocytogenes]
MASIVKRGESYRAQVSIYKHGKHKKLTKTFSTKADANRWALENELEKGNGKELAKRTTAFADYFENWIHVIKKNDVKETTFQNYQKTSQIIKKLFGDIQLKDLNDIVVQRKIDEYAQTHSRKTTHEVLLKIKTALRDAYARGYLTNDFAGLVKTRGENAPKRNKALSITYFKKLRTYLMQYTDNEFHVLVLLALETGMRRGELLALRSESLYEYGVKVRHSISPTSTDTSLKTKNSKRDISINKEVYEILKSVPVKEDGFKQAERLAKLLQQLDIPKTTFHGLRDTHASFLFSQEIDIAYVSQRLGHVNIQTTQNYYLQLMPEKKHQQDADALSLLNSLSS